MPDSSFRSLVAVWRGSIVAALALVLAADARAQNASTPGVLELYPTLQCVGARLHYTGDLDTDATAHLEWRGQGGVWTRGVEMSRIANSRWAGSVLWLQPGLPYEVRAVIDDPDGGGSSTAGVTTRREPITTPTGATWWVSPAGNDLNPGTLIAPLATLQEGANRAQPGDQIRVLPGTYDQRVIAVTPGIAQAPIHLVANATGVMLDGSNPAYRSRSDWRNDGGGVFSVPFAGWTRLVCADSAQRLYRQRTLAELQSNFNGMTAGWTLEAGRLWVKLADLSSPNAHVMHVAQRDVGIELRGSNWRVQGFELRYFGSDTVWTGTGIPASAGILLRGVTGCHVTDNVIQTIGGRGIFVIDGAADNLIERNLCRDPRIGWWSRGVSKAHEEEIQGISMRGGRGNVIRFNTCVGTFDGIDASSDSTHDENLGSDLDLHDNLLRWTADDAIEPEEMSGINVRIWRNNANHTYYGISISPNWQGPTYVLYNVFANYTRGGVKLSIDSSGQTWFCHNTFTTTVNATHAVWPTGPYSYKHFRNNILIGRGQQTVGDEESLVGNDFNGDLLWATGTSALFTWKGTTYTSIGALRTATGFELSGGNASPMFADSASGNYAPLAGSAALNAGLRLYGINDIFGGSGPDIGAIEVGPLLDAPPSQPGAVLEFSPAAPNPTRGPVHARFTLPRAVRVSATVFDAGGRSVRRIELGVLAPGEHALDWDGLDGRSRPAPPGLYLLRISAGGETASRPVVRLR